MSMNERNESNTDSSVNLTFGEILSAARAAKNMESADVAMALKLGPDKIQAIEKSDIHALPPAAFTIGYLRSYAKLVGVNEQEVIDAYNRLSGNTVDSVTLGAVSDLPAQTTSDHLGMRIVSYSLISLIVVLFILWLQGNSSEQQDAAVAEKPVAESTVQSTTEEAAQVKETAVLPEDVQAASDTAENKAEEVTDKPDAENGTEQAASDEAGSDADSRTANPVAPSGDDLLHISAENDCWADIVDANEFLLYRSLLRSGNEIELKGQAPFRVFLGDASVVKLSINQISYDISSHIRSNKTARFEISEKKALKAQQKFKDEQQKTGSQVEGESRPAELDDNAVVQE